jgi:hypothetical protein
MYNDKTMTRRALDTIYYTITPCQLKVIDFKVIIEEDEK